MNLVQFRWIPWDFKDNQPPRGAVAHGSGAQISFMILQYRERENILEIGLQEPIWSEWRNT